MQLNKMKYQEVNEHLEHKKSINQFNTSDTIRSMI